MRCTALTLAVVTSPCRCATICVGCAGVGLFGFAFFGGEIALLIGVGAACDGTILSARGLTLFGRRVTSLTSGTAFGRAIFGGFGLTLFGRRVALFIGATTCDGTILGCLGLTLFGHVVTDFVVSATRNRTISCSA